MNIDSIMQIITTVGFPICCCMAMGWYINKQSTQHKEEMNAMAEAINKNTLVMEKLLAKLEE